MVFSQVLNKTDLVKPEEVQRLADLFLTESKADVVLPVAAKFGTGVQQVKEWALQQLEEGPSLYPKVVAGRSIRHRTTCSCLRSPDSRDKKTCLWSDGDCWLLYLRMLSAKRQRGSSLQRLSASKSSSSTSKKSHTAQRRGSISDMLPVMLVCLAWTCVASACSYL